MTEFRNLIQIDEKNFDVFFDLRYATANNVCDQKLYSEPFCYLHQDAAEALKKAIKLAKNLGFKIKIFDTYRPLEIQQFMFDKFSADPKKDGFVSNPNGGVIPHCRGVAIDLTLTNLAGKELEMGSDFDEFSDLAFHGNEKISVEAQQNRLMLLGIMTLAGWDFYSKEWWHYQLFKPRDYPVISSAPGMVAI